MTNKNKIKGYGFEHFVVEDLKKEGIKVIRAGQANQPDLIVDGFGVIECKCWAKGLKFAYNLLKDNAAVVVKWQSHKAVSKEPVVFIKYELFKELLSGR